MSTLPAGAPRVLTNPLGGPAITRAAVGGALPDGWYAPIPRGGAEWARHAEATRAGAKDGWFAALRPAFGADGPTGAAATRLMQAAERGVVVTTGQQPGLFGGPLMTLAKALAARALADVLEAQVGMPVAPVFWAATDDADFAEGASIAFAAPDGVHHLALTSAPADGTPMAAARLGDEVTGLVAELERYVGSTMALDMIDTVRQAYVPGATVGEAYLRTLRAVLEPLGIAVLDASHPVVRAASRPLLQLALEGAAAVEEASLARAKAIEAAGYRPQVEPVKGLSLVFLYRDGVRRRVPIVEAAAAAGGGGELGPNVLLRPVVERSILPTVTYVAGPGEMAYFAQVSAVADALHAAVPTVVPRWSATIVEPRIQRILDRLELSADALASPDAVETRLARAAMPEGVSTALDRLREALRHELTAIEADPEAKLLVPDAAVEGARRWIEFRLARLERRFAAAVKRRGTDALRDVTAVRAALWPDGKRQERALGFIAFVIRYGTPLLDDMIAAAAVHAGAVTGIGSAPESTASVAR